MRKNREGVEMCLETTGTGRCSEVILIGKSSNGPHEHLHQVTSNRPAPTCKHVFSKQLDSLGCLRESRRVLNPDKGADKSESHCSPG